MYIYERGSVKGEVSDFLQSVWLHFFNSIWVNLIVYGLILDLRVIMRLIKEENNDFN